ncbi:uncharacterized protein [Oscarella lobularis]|uniref:uncharacterized protein isoform X2 n=1 Tax=Oscarella lobularis TaxID=121494 RepID=UPI00331419FF
MNGDESIFETSIDSFESSEDMISDKSSESISEQNSYESLIVQGISLKRAVLLSTEYLNDSMASQAVRQHNIRLHTVLVIRDETESMLAFSVASSLSLILLIVTDSRITGKEVRVHLTFDGWQTQCDYKAEWIRASENGVEKFSLQVQLGEDVWQMPNKEDLVQFAIVLRAGDNEWWDNNYGFSYRLK